MKALVSGSAGFVGRNMVKRLDADGWDVYCLDIATHPSEDCRLFFEGKTAPFGDPAPELDLFIHAGAVIGNRADRDSNPLGIVDNLSIDAAAAQWIARTGPAHTVWFSSSAAYPGALQSLQTRHRLDERDINLDRPELPDEMYGWMKLTGEYLVRELWALGHRVHVFRPQSGYGTDQSLDYPFPSIVRRAAWRADPFEVWGTGEQVRDFVHIDDVVACVMAVVEADELGPINICSGIPTSMAELAKLAARCAGYEPTFEYRAEMPMGTMFRCGDPAKMFKFYTPKVSLKEGIGRALQAFMGSQTVPSAP